MAIKKIRMRPEGGNDYGDVLHPETSADMVLSGDGTIQSEVEQVKSNLAAHKAGSATQAHMAKNIGLEDATGNFVATEIEGAMSELFTNVSDGKDLVGGAITDVDDSVVIPTDPTFQQLANSIGQISTGIEVNGAVEEYISEDNGIDKGDFVRFVNKTPARGGNTRFSDGYVYGTSDFISDTEVLIAYANDKSNRRGTVKLGTVSGNTIVHGSSFVYSSETSNLNKIIDIGSNKALIVFTNTTGLKASILTVNNGNISMGNVFDLNSDRPDYNNSSRLIHVGSNKYLFSYRKNSSPNNGKLCLVSVVNDVVSLVSEVDFHGVDGVNTPALDKLSDGKVILAYSGSNDSNGYARILTVNSNNITVGISVIFNSGGGYRPDVTALSSNAVLLTYESGGKGWARSLLIDGNSISVGGESQYNVQNIQFGYTTKLTSNKVLLAFRETGGTYSSKFALVYANGTEIVLTTPVTYSTVPYGGYELTPLRNDTVVLTYYNDDWYGNSMVFRNFTRMAKTYSSYDIGGIALEKGSIGNLLKVITV